MGQLTFIISLLMLNILSNCAKLNNDLSTTESTCENRSTCFSQFMDYTSEMNLPSTRDDVFLTISLKSTIIIDNITVTSLTSLPTVLIDNMTTQVPAPTPESNKEAERTHIRNKNCHCDITPNSCDINCCCDSDCSNWERAAFSTCMKYGSDATFGQCMSTETIYKNNTPYPTTTSVGGFLCIAKDNFPERTAYIDQEVIKSIEKFEKVWKRKIYFYWVATLRQPLKKFEKTVLYKFDDPVWIYNNDTEEAHSLDFPASIASATSVCRRRKHVQYLKKFKTSCLQLVPISEEECLKNMELNGRNYCQDLIIISSPSLVNSTEQIMNSPEEAFIKVKQLICKNDYCYETSSFPEPKFDKEKSVCLNSVVSVNILLIHNGSLGIKEAICKITMDSPSSRNDLFEQRFEVDYVSAHSNSGVVFHRSGTPGYRDGMPVITNLKKGQETKIKTSLRIVSGDNCDHLSSVLFKENSRTQCTLKFPLKSTLNCTFLEEQIITRMLKGIGEIGVTGDPEAWLEPSLPLITASLSSPSCLPVSSLSLQFLYAYSGPINQPEAKIIGFLSKFGWRKSPQCSQEVCSLRLFTTVSFSDVSRPVVSKYASAPVVKIKLPQDFFYPFSSSASICFKDTLNILNFKLFVTYFVVFILMVL